MTDPLPHDRCATCHVNVHRDSIKDDCKTCHTESTFRGAPFDHAARTRYPLDGKHVGLECAKCHTSVSPPEVPLAKKVVDYGGASRECVACHGGPKDPHKGTFDRTCDSCHRTATFDVKAFTHAGTREFYLGSHEKVACDKCHVPGRTPLGTRVRAPQAGVRVLPYRCAPRAGRDRVRDLPHRARREIQGRQVSRIREAPSP